MSMVKFDGLRLTKEAGRSRRARRDGREVCYYPTLNCKPNDRGDLPKAERGLRSKPEAKWPSRSYAIVPTIC